MAMVRIGDVRLHVCEKGSGRPILLVHGFPLDHTMWEAQIETLCASYRVIAPDLRGFGLSDVTPGTVTMRQYADDLVRLLDALEIAEPVVYCGLSMGGYIGWEFLREHRARLRALIAADTRAEADSAETAANRHRTVESLLERGPEVLAGTMLTKLLCEKTRREHPQLLERLRRTILRTHPEGAAAALRGMAQRCDARDLLPQIRLPTLFVVGSDDIISTVDEMRSMAQAVPDAQFVEIPDAGHLAPLEQPAAFNEALDRFLAALR